MLRPELQPDHSGDPDAISDTDVLERKQRKRGDPSHYPIYHITSNMSPTPILLLLTIPQYKLLDHYSQFASRLGIFSLYGADSNYV